MYGNSSSFLCFCSSGCCCCSSPQLFSHCPCKPISNSFRLSCCYYDPNSFQRGRPILFELWSTASPPCFPTIFCLSTGPHDPFSGPSFSGVLLPFCPSTFHSSSRSGFSLGSSSYCSPYHFMPFSSFSQSNSPSFSFYHSGPGFSISFRNTKLCSNFFSCFFQTTTRSSCLLCDRFGSFCSSCGTCCWLGDCCVTACALSYSFHASEFRSSISFSSPPCGDDF